MVVVITTGTDIIESFDCVDVCDVDFVTGFVVFNVGDLVVVGGFVVGGPILADADTTDAITQRINITHAIQTIIYT